MNKGQFIVFEGGEGSGKTTMIKQVASWFDDNNISYIITREPGGIKISEQIRNIILDLDNKEMDEKTEALLYAAARRQHLVQKVIPALNDGMIVLCDRFLDSSLAYQGYARGIGIQDIYNINKFAIDGYEPDISIIFDLDPQIGISRINKDKEREVNRLDKEKLDFHQRVREGYSKIIETTDRNIIKIDASKPMQDVFEDVKNIIHNNIDIFKYVR